MSQPSLSNSPDNGNSFENLSAPRNYLTALVDRLRGSDVVAARNEARAILELGQAPEVKGLSELARTTKRVFDVSEAVECGDFLHTLVVNEGGLMVQNFSEKDSREWDLACPPWLPNWALKIRDAWLDARYGECGVTYTKPTIIDILDCGFKASAVSARVTSLADSHLSRVS